MIKFNKLLIIGLLLVAANTSFALPYVTGTVSALNVTGFTADFSYQCLPTVKSVTPEAGTNVCQVRIAEQVFFFILDNTITSSTWFNMLQTATLQNKTISIGYDPSTKLSFNIRNPATGNILDGPYTSPEVIAVSW